MPVRRRSLGDEEQPEGVLPGIARAGAVRVERSGAARADRGAIANTGVHHGDTSIDNSVHFHLAGGAGLSEASSAYADLVRERFFEPVRDHAAVLAQLKRFCTAEQGPDYVWWQADAYAGKTTLMANLVVDPPPGVRVVSFFIAPRFGHDSRDAYVENILAQLAAVAGQPLPPPSASRWPEQLSRLVVQAADFCRGRGERLVLVVDGLDEDRGVQGPGGHSIAALLPQRPVHGLRVVVSGRANPQVPHDVPRSHPLRDDSIVRELAPSREAVAFRDQAEAELERVLSSADADSGRATVSGRELVGFLAVAHGPLTVADMAQLTGAAPYLVEQALSRTVRARSFQRVRLRTSPMLPEVYGYVLAHTELVVTARLVLAAELPGLLDRLHGWAGSYRPDLPGKRPGWPTSTPDYLFDGFFSLLCAHHDLDSVVAFALDSGRHQQMFERRGTNRAGLSETSAAIEMCVEAEDPDVRAVAVLAAYREHFSQRTRNVPVSLPALWTMLAQLDHAVDLAHSIELPLRRVQALVAVVGVLVQVEESERAAVVAQDAESAAAEIGDRPQRTQALAAVAMSWISAGQLDRADKVIHDARRVAYEIDEPHKRDQALLTVAQMMVQAGRIEDGERLAMSLDDPSRRAVALMAVAQSAAAGGELDRGKQIGKHAAHVAAGLDDPWTRALTLAAMVGPLATLGEVDRAVRIARQAERDARGLANNRWGQSFIYLELSRGLATVGNVEDAERVADSIERSGQRDDARVMVIEVLTKAGKIQDAARVADHVHNTRARAEALVALVHAHLLAENFQDAERIAYAIDDATQRDAALVDLAPGLAVAGQFGDAERVARDVGGATQRADALIGVARGLFLGREFDHARRLALDAERIAISAVEVERPGAALSDIARALAQTGNIHEAGLIADAINDPLSRDEALTEIVRAHARDGNIHDAEHVTGGINNPSKRDEALTEIVRAHARDGNIHDAERVTSDISDQWQALIEVAQALARADRVQDSERAASSIEPQLRGEGLIALAKTLAEADHVLDAERVASRIDDRGQQVAALVGIVEVLAQAGNLRDAERVTSGITDSRGRGEAFGALARALARGGDVSGAEWAASGIDDPTPRARALADVARELARLGQLRDAERIAFGIDDPKQRADALMSVARALARAGHVRDAERVASGIDEPSRRAVALTEISRALAEAGQWDGAAKSIRNAQCLASRLDTPRRRAIVLTRVAYAWAEARYTREAELAAREIEGADLQANALIVIAGSLVASHRRGLSQLDHGHTGDQQLSVLASTARRALARAMSLADWRKALPVLAELDPPAAVDIAHALADTARRETIPPSASGPYTAATDRGASTSDT